MRVYTLLAKYFKHKTPASNNFAGEKPHFCANIKRNLSRILKQVRDTKRDLEGGTLI